MLAVTFPRPFLRRQAVASVCLVLLAGLAAGPAALAQVIPPPPVGWKAQTTQMGAGQALIVLNNCDDSDKDGLVDNRDGKVNGPLDAKQLETVVLEGRPLSLPLSIQIQRTAGENFPIRVFKVVGITPHGPDAVEIIGPTKVGRQESYVLTEGEENVLLKGGKLTFLVEGLDFAATCKLLANQPRSKIQSVLDVRTAPLMLLPHTQPPILNMVSQMNAAHYADVSGKYVKQFAEHCKTANVEYKTVPTFMDQWTEDEFQWGVTETPRQHLHVMLHLSRQRELSNHIRRLVAPNVGYYALWELAEIDGSLYYGGNLEVAPPTPKYPFGRVYFGNKPSPANDGLSPNGYPKRLANQAYFGFFQKQGIQPPIDLWTDWLTVGHVDEVVSFLPAKNTKTGKNFVMVLASPQLAWETLDAASAASRRFGFHDYYKNDYNLFDMENLRKGMMNRVSFLGQGAERYNMWVHAKIFGRDFAKQPNPPSHPQSIRAQFMQELDLAEEDILEVPVLFGNSHQNLWAASAISPGVVNLSSMGEYAMMPDPFIAEYRDLVEKTLATIGQKALWIDDWKIYHANHGEVHCGSNMMRQPFDLKWWTK